MAGPFAGEAPLHAGGEARAAAAAQLGACDFFEDLVGCDSERRADGLARREWGGEEWTGLDQAWLD